MSIFPTILKNARRRNYQLFLYGIVVTAIFALFYIFEPPFFRFLELRFYDTLLRENPIDKPSTDIVIVDIDESSLKEFGQWPWPRYLVALLLKKIRDDDPSVIGVDLLFPEKDRTSLSAVLRHIKEAYGFSPQMENIPPGGMDNDRLLVETLRTGPFVLAEKFIFPGQTVTFTECVLHPVSVVCLDAAGANPEDKPFHQASGVICNLPMFDSTVAANGFTNVPFDIDGLVRRIPLIIRYASDDRSPEYFPSLALAAVMKQKNIRQVSVKTDSGRPYEILLGNIVIPVDGIGNMLINFSTDEKAFPYVSAADIMSDRLPRSSLKGKIVFVGTSATGLGERRITPIHPFLPGVEIHATVAKNILQSNFIQRPSWISGLEFFFILLAGILSTVLFIRTNAKWSLLLLIAVAVGLWFVSYWSFGKVGIIVSPLIPLSTVAANFSVLSLVKFWQSERALRRSESQYRSIFDNAIEGICRITPEGRIVAANQSLARMMGFASSEDMFTKITHIQSIRFANPGTLQELLELLLNKSVIRAYETELYTGSGTKIWVTINATATVNDENLPFYEASVEDISDRKRSEEALQESRQRLSDIIDFLPDATMVIDRDGRVVAWNRAMEALTGIKKEKMLGKGYQEYALPFYGKRRPILIDLALHPDPEIEKQYTVIRRMGDILFGEAYTTDLPPGNVHLSSMASVLRNSHGEVIAAIECIRDNTERKKMEERLSRAEKMEALGTLAGGVAHDLNNVLGVLVGYSELLADQLPKDSPLKRHADNILKSSIRGAAIIQDLLTLARRGVTISEVVDLNRVVSDYLKTPEFINLKSQHPQIEILTELEDGLLNIKGSPIHLGKTVMNLVLNAAEAISGRGKVTIRTENCYLDHPIRGYDEMQEGDYAVLKVSDTGNGISADDLGKIFEPFFTKKVMGKSGTGLGLAVVWGTVKDHHGYIDVQSEENKGSTFILYFPATREKMADIEKAVSPDSYSGKGESILIVDDAKEQRELAMNMLGRLGYRVEAVASGEEAIEYMKSKKAALIVLDMIMEPGMDGMETYRRVLEINPGQKAVIVSGFSETDRVRMTQEMGAGAFVRKPYILEKIGLAVRNELDRR